MENSTIHSGIEALDDIVQGMRLGDNVVVQIENLDDYRFFAVPFADAAIADHWPVVYLRFGSHPPVLQPKPGLEIVELNPALGFDAFTREVHELIEARGPRVFYIFDNLSTLVVEWATDESLANFFQVTCPFLFELYTIAYFALTRGRHGHGTVARIRDTTQILLDVYTGEGKKYLHPIKVWDRYSPQMFLPHVVEGDNWIPLSHSHSASRVQVSARESFVRDSARQLAPWESVTRKLLRYQESSDGFDENDPEQAALKLEACRMLFGQHPSFTRLAERYMTLDLLFAVRNRLIGSGRIGGKAAGMLMARSILAGNAPAGLTARLEDHDSFYIGSDVFFTFLVDNDLFRLRMKLTRTSDMQDEDFQEVERRFLAGNFPEPIREQFRAMLEYYGQAPIIVRSSSLLEDSFGNAFAGKYRSIFCANQGDPEARLAAFLEAVKLVYASALNPDALSYRSRRGLGDTDEQMAILVQRVSGMPFRNYFFPSLAGVAYSRNLYVWTDRIDPAKGMIRLVFGLGTRAVERVDSDYPRMIAVSHPFLRPEAGEKIAKYSQHKIDLLDIGADRFETCGVEDVLSGGKYPNLHLYVSVMRDNHPFDPMTWMVEGDSSDWVLTFNNLLSRTDIVSLIGQILASLENAYGQPVDIEFTASVDDDDRVHVNVLQCRPLILPGWQSTIQMPGNLERQRVLFRSQRMICGGLIEKIRYILYIDPKAYSHRTSLDMKKKLGRIVGQINRHSGIRENRIIMMGPGRWGSSNINLGVNVTYSDIDNAAVLVEVASEEGGQVPELSYGTHFFQDLVEAGIIYLPVYPETSTAEFQSEFFSGAQNVLLDLLPGAAEFETVLQLIDVPQTARGAYARVVADPRRQEAVCFLEE